MYKESWEDYVSIGEYVNDHLQKKIADLHTHYNKIIDQQDKWLKSDAEIIARFEKKEYDLTINACLNLIKMGHRSVLVSLTYDGSTEIKGWNKQKVLKKIFTVVDICASSANGDLQKGDLVKIDENHNDMAVSLILAGYPYYIVPYHLLTKIEQN